MGTEHPHSPLCPPPAAGIRSRALAPGEPLPTIGKLLGFARAEITARYAYPARDSARKAALLVSESIAAYVPGEGAKPKSKDASVAH